MVRMGLVRLSWFFNCVQRVERYDVVKDEKGLETCPRPDHLPDIG
jgi:hypothetical protein